MSARVDDLVARLRAEKPIGMLSGCCDTVEPVNPDGPEAADEIERLRARVAELEATVNEMAGV